MIDRIEIYVYGGRGGNGIVSFRREKFVPFGGPDGGDGGKGGSVVLIADQGKTTLSNLRHRKHYRAQHGGKGKGREQHGSDGRDLVLGVPVGTIVRSVGEGVDLGDLTVDGQRLVVAKGGKGGWGNKHFATAIKQVPRIAKEGGAGEERKLVLDLKLIADVGLIGRPNVGKSTLINAVSAARSKVADYPFTTLEPKLGVVELGFRAFVIADIPGLIEGAHTGRGLGHDFLRHIERTRILIHIIDGTTRNPVSDLEEINEELRLFNSCLKDKPQIVAVNKIDIPDVRERLPQIEKALVGIESPLYFISAASGEGLPQLMTRAAAILDEEVIGKR
ncbi:MAG: GTPase ObgE [Dehalococcoidia bacterium]|nr:GTPase Obg [Chloroflexota bacterium]MBT9162302.1 GTPase Obg [Chloroflexota bacterium]